MANSHGTKCSIFRYEMFGSSASACAIYVSRTVTVTSMAYSTANSSPIWNCAIWGRFFNLAHYNCRFTSRSIKSVG